MQNARIINHIRLAGFPVAYGLSGALIGGTFNRIMVAELGMPLSLVAFFFTIPLFVSPLRVWFGYRSDGYPLFGRRREPYIILGSLLIGLGITAISFLMTHITETKALMLQVLLAFFVYGVGRNLGHNSFQALVSDRFAGHEKTQAATLYEVATLIGVVAGAGVIGKVLETYDPQRLIAVSLGVALAVFFLTVTASMKQESSPAGLADAEKARSVSFGTVLRQFVLFDRQVRIFFVMVFFTFIGTLAQDVLLEPYGALVLKMSVGETTRLTSFWGLGVLLSMLLSGSFLLRKLGYMTILRIGIIASILVFLGLIAAGLLGRPALMKGLVFFMGLGTGLAGAGMLSAAISFTTRVRAGMLMGVWGVANMSGHAAGSLMGGAVVDIVSALTGSPQKAYGTVFVLEVVMLIAAFYLSTLVNIGTSRAGQEQQAKEAPMPMSG